MFLYKLAIPFMLLLASTVFYLLESSDVRLISNIQHSVSKDKYDEISRHINALFHGYREDDVIKYWSGDAPIGCYIFGDDERYLNDIDSILSDFSIKLGMEFSQCKLTESLPPKNSLFFFIL